MKVKKSAMEMKNDKIWRHGWRIVIEKKKKNIISFFGSQFQYFHALIFYSLPTSIVSTVKFYFYVFPSQKFILFNKWNLIKRFFSHNNKINFWSFLRARCCRVECWRAMVRYKIEQNGYYDQTELRMNYAQKTCNIATLT